MEKKTINDKICSLLLPIVWAFILLFCVFLFSSTSHAASLYFPMEQNYNNLFSENDKSFFETTFDSENNYIFVHYYRYTRFKNCHVFVFSKSDTGSICGEINNNGYQFSLYKIGDVSSVCYDYQYDSGNDTWFKTATITGNGLNQFVNVDSNLYTSTTDYISNFQLYTNNSDNKEVVLSFSDGPLIEFGHATAPDPFNDPVVNSGSNHTLPREVPESPSINNYTWITYNPPTIDTTNVESLLESIFYIINYLAGYIRDNLSGEFQNLISNITVLINYIVETIQYYCGLIISNIQNGIQTFYNNMVSLFEPMFEKISETAALFIHPFDEEEFEDQIENSDFLNAYNELMANSEVLNDIFDNAEERDHFSLYISFENPFADTSHRIISSEINFDWLVPLRSVYRPFLWVCTLIELFVGGARVLTHILGGKGV